MSARTNGCHSRPAYVETYAVQDGYYGNDRTTRFDKMVDVPHVLSKACEYSRSALGAKDAGCVGCVWKNKDATSK